MFLKIINHRRKQPRKKSDLRRLLRYLFTPKLSRDLPGGRLLGPPQLHKLAVSTFPWGEGASEAAHQLTRQMDRYSRVACTDRAMPDVWYVHVIVSFAPAATEVLKNPVDRHQNNPRWHSTSQNTYRVARDVLDFLGWTPNRPSIFVAHGDRRHVHVHVVALIPTLNDDDWNVLRTSRRQLNEVAKLCADAYGIPLASRPSTGLYRRYAQLLDVEVNWA